MLNIPEAVKQLFKSGESQNYSMSINVGTTKYFTNTLYTIPEENIKGESAELRETLFSGNNPKFGTIQTSQFTVSLLNFNLLLKGKYIRVFLHYGPALNIIPYGEFYVESVEKAPYSSETKLICYDYSYFLNVQAANKIRRIPTATASTAISMCEAIFDKLHLQYTPFTSSTTYNYVTKIPDNTTYGNMLEWMGELYGGWWKPDRYGVFRFVQIGSSASPESIDTFRPKAGEHETSQIPDFTGIIFNSLLRLEETKEQDYLYGSDDGLVYTMDKSNPYIVNYNESQLNALGQTLLPIYNSIKYIPNKIKIDGRPYLECGDWYTYLTDDDTEDQLQITAPVIQSIISGIGALNQTLQAVGQSQTTGTLDGTEYNQSSERTVIKDTQTIVSTGLGGDKEVYYGTSLPTTDIGQDSALYYKTIQRPEDLKTLNVMEYITAKSGVYIPTDIYPTADTRIEMVGWFTAGDWHGFNKAFGTLGNTDSNQYGRIVVVTSAFESNGKAEFWYGDDVRYLQREAQMPINQKCTIICDIPTRTCYLNGTETSAQITIPDGVIYQDSLTPLAILHSNKSSTAGGMEVQADYRETNGGARIYRFRIYRKGVLAYDMIPVINANNPEDGGLYDRIHRKYYPGEWAQGGYSDATFVGSNPTGEVINQLDECVEAGYLRVNDEWWEIYNSGTEYFAGNYIEITENNVITSTLKAGTNIQIADDGTISASTAEIVQIVTSGTEIATIDGTSIYAPTVSASQTQTSGTEIGTVTVGDTSTKLYAPTTTVTQVLTEGTEIAQVNGTSLYAPTGGGSDVTVTPKTSTGTNIADIEVDGTTYQLFAPTSGGGGGGSGYTKTILWSGYKSDTGTITLSDSVENYDIILIKFTSHPNQPTTQYYESYCTILPDEIVYNQNAQYCLLAIRATAHYGDGSMDCYFSNSTSFVIETINIDSSARLTKPAVLEIIGLKLSTTETALIYSNEERVVGVWTDNKPLYQKTLNLTSPSGAFEAAVIADLTSLNIENLVKVEGFLYSATYSQTLPIYWSYAVSSGFSNSNWGTVYYENTYLKQNLSSTAYTQCPVTITIQYTKTTDTPGSGPYVTSGAYAHHYSTTEQVVGTWIDGSTLYEKTFTGTCPNRTGQISVQTLNEEILAKSISGYIEYAQGTDVFIPNYESSTWKAIFTISTVNGVSDLRLDVGSDFFNKPFYITIQYTKTS